MKYALLQMSGNGLLLGARSGLLTDDSRISPVHQEFLKEKENHNIVSVSIKHPACL